MDILTSIAPRVPFHVVRLQQGHGSAQLRAFAQLRLTRLSAWSLRTSAWSALLCSREGLPVCSTLRATPVRSSSTWSEAENSSFTWSEAEKRCLVHAQQLLRAGGLGVLAPRLAEAGPTYEMLLALDANNPRRGVRRSVLDKLGSVRCPSSASPLSSSTSFPNINVYGTHVQAIAKSPCGEKGC